MITLKCQKHLRHSGNITKFLFSPGVKLLHTSIHCLFIDASDMAYYAGVRDGEGCCVPCIVWVDCMPWRPPCPSTEPRGCGPQVCRKERGGVRRRLSPITARTRYVRSMPVQSRTVVCDAGPALDRHWIRVSRLRRGWFFNDLLNSGP